MSAFVLRKLKSPNLWLTLIVTHVGIFSTGVSATEITFDFEGINPTSGFNRPIVHPGTFSDLQLADIPRIPGLSNLILRPWEARGNKICSRPTG
jgi:hypothetical protein